MIDNRGGGGGSLGTDIAAKSLPDGCTVLFTLSSHTINPAIYPKLPFDTLKDSEPIGTVAVAAADPRRASGVSGQHGGRADQGRMKERPGFVQFASVGNGSPGHLAGELFNIRTGADIVHVPYRGGGPAINDVVGGRCRCCGCRFRRGAVRQDRPAEGARRLDDRRSAAFPDCRRCRRPAWRTSRSTPGTRCSCRRKTPAHHREAQQGAEPGRRDPEIREKLLAQGSEGVGGSPEMLGKVVAPSCRWAKLVNRRTSRQTDDMNDQPIGRA